MSGQYGRRDQIKSEVVKKEANFRNAYASPEPSDCFSKGTAWYSQFKWRVRTLCFSL